jgi:hypothetical protein
LRTEYMIVDCRIVGAACLIIRCRQHNDGV